jgi:hypothetical protein
LGPGKRQSWGNQSVQELCRRAASAAMRFSFINNLPGSPLFLYLKVSGKVREEVFGSWLNQKGKLKGSPTLTCLWQILGRCPSSAWVTESSSGAPEEESDAWASSASSRAT